MGEEHVLQELDDEIDILPSNRVLFTASELIIRARNREPSALRTHNDVVRRLSKDSQKLTMKWSALKISFCLIAFKLKNTTLTITSIADLSDFPHWMKKKNNICL